MSPPRADVVALAWLAADFACAEIDRIRWISQSSLGARQSPGSRVHVTTLN